MFYQWLETYIYYLSYKTIFESSVLIKIIKKNPYLNKTYSRYQRTISNRYLGHIYNEKNPPKTDGFCSFEIENLVLTGVPFIFICNHAKQIEKERKKNSQLVVFFFFLALRCPLHYLLHFISYISYIVKFVSMINIIDKIYFLCTVIYQHERHQE